MKVSISSLKLFKACRRKYELRYIEGLEPISKSDALQTGTNYHAKIEEIYDNGFCTVSDNSKESAMALAYEKYIYPHFSVKSAEDWFSYDLGNGDTLVGITDGLSEDGCIVEHKTTASNNLDEYEFNLQWDEQILAYMLAKGMRKVYYTVCKKPTIRQKQNESDDEFFDRMCKWYDDDTESKIRLIEITRTDEEVEEFRQALLKMVDELKTTKNYYKNTMHCNCYNVQCEYVGVCLHYNPDEEYVGFVKNERRDKNGN